MPTHLTLTFTDEHGQTRHVQVTNPRFHIGRSPDNELAIADSNLSRRHALIELRTDTAYISDLGSQNGTTIGDRPVTGSVRLNDGDTITLGAARRLRVTLQHHAASQQTAPPTAQPIQQPPTHNANAQPLAAPPSSDAPTASSATPAWLSLPALAGAGAALIVVCAAIILLFSVGGGGDAESEQATTANDPLAAAVAEELADDAASDDADDPAPARQSSSTDTNTDVALPSAVVNAGAALTTADATAAVPALSTDAPVVAAASSEDQIARLAKRAMSRISTDNTPYISAAGISDVQKQIETYRNSTALAARLNSMRNSCGEITALARSNNLKGSLVALAALAQSETSADPAATAREMMPKLLTLRATFGTETANSTLLLIAAYPYPFDPRLGSQTRTAHPLASKLMQYGGKGSTVDTSVARSVWFLREQGGITPEAYALVVRLIAIGVIAQDPARYGVAAEPLLC